MKKFVRIFIASFLSCAIMLSIMGVCDVQAKSMESISMTVVTKKLESGKSNALARAKSYLNYTAFSKSGLYDQLRYEGYTKKQCRYAVNHCGANWKKQAVKKAKQYLKYSSFSKSGLYEQLKYEGFTTKQAKYAVNKVY